MPTPVRYPFGVTNVDVTSDMGNLPFLDPTKYITWFDDFHDYDANQWLITTVEAGAGDASEAVGNLDGGVLVITNDANDTDADYLQWSGVSSSAATETFKFTVGKKLWFKARWKISAVTDLAVVMGLQITDTAPIDVTDGVFFSKADLSTTLNLLVEKNNTATTTAVGTMVADTYVVTSFYYNGKNAIEVFLNDVKVGTSAVTNLPDDEELTISFGMLNGAAVAHVLSIDYIFVTEER
jgi:hypothetical protein